MDILDQFGIDPLLLAAQIVNFLILLFLLKKFLYKPLLKVLDERKRVISESLKNADEIEKRLEKIAQEREKRLQEASIEAKGLINDATKTATEIMAEAHQKAEADTKRLIENAQKTISLEQDKMKQEINQSIANLVVLGLQKVTGKTLTDKEQKELIEKSLKDIKL